MPITKTLKSLAFLAAFLACGLTATDSQAQSRKEKAFYVTLDGDGAKKTIATNKPLKFVAQCELDSDGEDEVRIFAQSTQSGWFSSKVGEPLSRRQRVVMFSEDESSGEPTYEDDDGDGSIAAPNGAYMAIDGDTLGLGVNIFGHDCVAIGTVTIIKGKP